MPELPDVEVYRRRLEDAGVHRPIEKVQVRDPSLLRDVSEVEVIQALENRELVGTDRRGKHLFAATSGPATSGPATLVMHFGMTGVLQVVESPAEQGPHERLALAFRDGGAVSMVDPRRFGFVAVVDDVAAYCRNLGLGPDALSFELSDLRRLLRAHRGGVKAVLMDQGLIAGIGNIYSDEILYQARIDPHRRADSLEDAEVRRLHRQMLRVLRLAADRGADVSRFPEGWLLRHRQEGVACPRGDGQIRKVNLVGRGAYFCPGCQH